MSPHSEHESSSSTSLGWLIPNCSSPLEKTATARSCFYIGTVKEAKVPNFVHRLLLKVAPKKAEEIEENIDDATEVASEAGKTKIRARLVGAAEGLGEDIKSMWGK